MPLDLTSDRGSQFTSKLWSAVTKLLGIKLHHTTAYHPQANGLVERFHRHLKPSLRARLSCPNWLDALLWVLLDIRTAPKDDLRCSSAELLYSVPGDFIAATPKNPHARQCPTTATGHCQRVFTNTYHPPLQTTILYAPWPTKWFIRHDVRHSALQSPYEGPFHVISRDQKFSLLTLVASPTQFPLTASNRPTLTQINQFKYPSHGAEDVCRPSHIHQTMTVLGGESCGGT